MNEHLICKNVSLGYDGGVILSNLNFNLSRGDYLCIVGENGSGKSTLIKALLGLKPQVKGDIIINSQDSNLDKIGYLPQQTAIQKDFPATVKEIVISGCLNQIGLKPFYNKKQKETALENMKKLGIEHLAKRCYRELSGGQQQRVLLARALCATKSMLLLDEPATGLDPVATQEMYDLISSLNKNENITILMVSHDIAATLKYSTHILHIGDPIFFGTKEKYLASKTGKAFTDIMVGNENE